MPGYVIKLLQTERDNLKRFLSSDKNLITKQVGDSLKHSDSATSHVVMSLINEVFADVNKMLARVDSALSSLQSGTADYKSVDDLLKRAQFASFNAYANLSIISTKGREASEFIKRVKPSLDRLYRIDRNIGEARVTIAEELSAL